MLLRRRRGSKSGSMLQEVHLHRQTTHLAHSKDAEQVTVAIGGMIAIGSHLWRDNSAPASAENARHG